MCTILYKISNKIEETCSTILVHYSMHNIKFFYIYIGLYSIHYIALCMRTSFWLVIDFVSLCPFLCWFENMFHLSSCWKNLILKFENHKKQLNCVILKLWYLGSFFLPLQSLSLYRRTIYSSVQFLANLTLFLCLCIFICIFWFVQINLFAFP